MNPNTQYLIEKLKDKGYLVYGPEDITTYVWFVEPDGKRFGYAQYSRLEGPQYSTVHRPSSRIGTGFSAKSPEEALMAVPTWAVGKGFETPSKYPDFETFRSKHWCKMVQY